MSSSTYRSWKCENSIHYNLSARNVTLANRQVNQMRCTTAAAHLRTLTPSFFITPRPCSWYSARDIQNSSRSFMISASTAPPRNTMCFRRGGSSMRILNFYKQQGVAKCNQKNPNTLQYFLWLSYTIVLCMSTFCVGSYIFYTC